MMIELIVVVLVEAMLMLPSILQKHALATRLNNATFGATILVLP